MVSGAASPGPTQLWGRLRAAALCSANAPAHTATHTRTDTRYRFDGYEGMILWVRACVYLTLWLGVREGRLVSGLGAWDRKLGSARLVPGWTDDDMCS
jgi:hypothetical protein